MGRDVRADDLFDRVPFPLHPAASLDSLADRGNSPSQRYVFLGAPQTFYVWKKKYGSLGATELRELRQLREENGKLKRLVADLTLDKHILSEIVRKKV